MEKYIEIILCKSKSVGEAWPYGHITELQWTAAVTFVHEGHSAKNSVSVACLAWRWVSALPCAGAALLLAHQLVGGFWGMLQTCYLLTLSAVHR